jgi:murein hydrolase activator
MFKSPFLTGVLFLAVLYSRAQMPVQTHIDLEKERNAIQKEIEDVKRSLDQTHRNKKETLGQLALLQRKLYLRHSAIQDLNSQINYIQGDMNESWREIRNLRVELDTLRSQYAENMAFAYKNRSSYDLLNFIFSATSFNDAMKRIAYLKSYRAHLEERAENISRTQALLQSKIEGLKVSRQEKDQAFKEQNNEKAILEAEKKEKDAVVNHLKSQESELKKEMAVKQCQDQKLSAAISAVIRRANNASRESHNKAFTGSETATKPKTVTVFETENNIGLTGSFEKSKGRLAWPVSQGTISMAFGLQEYLPGVYHFNPGITLDVAPGTAVKAVFEGQVQSVLDLGEVRGLVIRHGKYFITYGNLSTISVSKDEQAKAGQTIGRVAALGKLEFWLSDDKINWLNPEEWLHR